jgi:hypothetical protein
MERVVCDATGVVVMLKVAEVWPAWMVTVGGTWAAGLLELRVTVVPPVGAAPDRVTVPVEPVPPVTVLIGMVTDRTATDAPMLKPELTVFPFTVAERLSEMAELTRDVVMANVLEVLPAGTVTLAGTWAARLLDASVTITPPVGAGLLKVTVPVLPAPPVTELGDDVIVWMATDEPMPKPELTVVEL